MPSNMHGDVLSNMPGGVVQVGHDLLTAAALADTSPLPVTVADRKKWLSAAATMFKSSRTHRFLAARYSQNGRCLSAASAQY